MGDDADRRVGDARTIRDRFDSLSLLVASYEGPELRVIAANAAFRAFVGREFVVGRTYHELFPEFAAQRISPMVEKIFATGEAQTGREWRFQVADPGDTRREYYLDFVIEPYRDADGAVAGITAIGIDVTDQVRRRMAEQERAIEAERRYARALDVISALQQQLLPPSLPVLPRLEVAGSYLPADADTAAGGDWFDAVVLTDGRVALVVGDVVGHGLAASATMGQLRVLLRERLLSTGDLLVAVNAVNTAAGWIPGARAATVCVAVLDPADGAMTYVTAGHPAPLLLPAGGDGAFLPATGARPLGVGASFGAETTGTATLDPGAAVLLYTDGVLERPGRPLSQASVELAQVAADAAANRVLRDDALPTAERITIQTVEVLTRMTGHTDDITLLAARRVDPPAPLRMTLALHQDDQLRQLRTRLSDWLSTCGAGDQDAGAIRHAVAELATNSLDHAYLDRADDDATCEITLTVRPDGRLEARVRDHGTWREPRPSADRGLGLQLATALVDRLHLHHDDHGTTAVLTHTLTRPAHLLTTEQLFSGRPVTPPGQADPLIVIDQPWAPSPRIRIDGPIDATTSAHVEIAVRTAGSAGTTDLTVDLTGVTHLASAGVAAFHRLAAEHQVNGTTLWWYAPTATPADVILTLVGLPHLTEDPHTP
ncbi:SpoIIE family protein phosphatase [Catenuloplanes atrovinosus]|uniref:Serine phosphatase RsbU (Regulator of sigma subunit)/anti-sigma regulatory factor (Ser/Thr protein kinase)/ABC-type transporter Mla MlaB component n=1 Tax=Catenuloplanes atrovinosus TaxID=137266 RepID=A0AAE3YV74_9ACTN|nr:SpoIIE family protein phosphatase [Catenuloplanes atrovinosus]MDR7279256.1 serine phosphatase RsbU (regulator of sigma subunit)/anti-sigma regulatory factor (Ser/Thr protein kinase)/ABC-type transporter Mla MlaB component [Catenuloplanes atrovinosus]